MPRLRRLNGKEVIAILEQSGFTAIQVRGSHHRLQRVVEGKNQYLTIPVHGNRALATGTLRSIYRQACVHIPEEQLKEHFYTE